MAQPVQLLVFLIDACLDLIQLFKQLFLILAFIDIAAKQEFCFDDFLLHCTLPMQEGTTQQAYQT